MSESHLHREEIWNALTHGVGVAAAVAGGAVLVTLAAIFGDVWQIVGAVVYTITLVLLFTASTLYHAIPHEVAKRRLKVADHCAIFLLIAGTYTPFTLVGLRGTWGWALFGVIWALAIAGIAFKLFFTGRFKKLSTLIYVLMGWLVVVAAVPLAQSVSALTLGLLIAGGLAYTGGTLFYLNRRIPYSHAIWHVFVLIGSACHFAAVLLHVAPLPG